MLVMMPFYQVIDLTLTEILTISVLLI